MSGKTKQEIRKQLRAGRKAHVCALPATTSALLFRIPPVPLLKLVDDGAAIGLYHSADDEAPTNAYSQFFAERGHEVALPRFQSASEPMHFALWNGPFGEYDLVAGAFGMMEPATDSPEIVPDVLILPVLGFTERGERIGQGGGHYDRWLADNPQALAIGLAWDVQLCQELPAEPHDKQLHAIVTPTRFYGPFNA